MKIFSNIPNHGRFDSIAALLNKNFGYAYMNFLELLYHHTKFLGLFPSEDEFGTFASENITAPEEGMYVYVGDSSPFDVITYTTFPIYQLDADGNPATGDDGKPIIIGTETRWGKTGTTDGSVTIATGSNADAVLTDEGEDEAGGFKWKGDLQAQRTVGGVNTGTKFKVGTLIEEIIRKIFAPAPRVPQKGAVSLSLSKREVEYGEKDIVVTITVTKNDYGAPSKPTLKRDSTDVTASLKDNGNGVYTYTDTSNVTAKHTYTTSVDFAKSADFGATTETASDSVTPYWYWFAGKASSPEVTAQSIRALPNKGFVRSAGTLSFSADSWNYIIIAFPADRKITNIHTATQQANWLNDPYTRQMGEVQLAGANNISINKYTVYLLVSGTANTNDKSFSFTLE